MVHDTEDRTSRRFISSVRVSQNQAEDFVRTNSPCSAVLTDIDPNLHADYLLESLEENVKVSLTATGKRKGNLTAERLAKNWGISLDSTKQTLKVTTQRGVRTTANPSLSRRFWTNDRQLRHCRLRCDMYVPLRKHICPDLCNTIWLVPRLPNEGQVGSARSRITNICKRWRAYQYGNGWL
jgi:hypothetical protein